MKSILITGCNRGIGLGLMKHLVQQKKPQTKVIATCRNIQQAKDLQEIASSTENITVLELDVTKFESHVNFAQQVMEIVKDDGLNVLVNNAGVAPRSTRIQFVKPEDMLETYKTNAVGPIMLTKTLLPLLKQAAQNNKDKQFGPEKALVVNVSSVLGSIAENENGGVYAYRCSKAALNMATRSLSVDLFKDGIMVTCIHPGWVKTDMGGVKAPLDVDSSVLGILNLVKSANEKHNGRFYQYDGKLLDW